MPGEPKPVEGKCNARLHIGDNYGDGHATMLCGLDPAHDGLHKEVWDSSHSGRVTITWEHEDPQIAIDELQRQIEQAIETAHPKASFDFEWLEDLETSAMKYTVDGKSVYFRIEALTKVWVAIGDLKQENEMPKDWAIKTLIEGLKP